MATFLNVWCYLVMYSFECKDHEWQWFTGLKNES